MGTKWERAAEDFMSSEHGKKLSANRVGLEKIANSSEGRKIRSMLEQQNIEETIESGDIAALKSALSNVMNTEAGTRLMSEISKIMEK